MAIEVSDITPSQLAQILALDEGHFGDLKAIDIAPAKLTRSISAFANASGGELYIGIDEAGSTSGKTRTWRGFADQESANGHLQAFHELFPLGQYFSYTFLRSRSAPGLVLQVEVRKARSICSASDGIVYVRRGAQNLPCKTADDLTRLKLDKGVQSFETETVDAPIKMITKSVTIIDFLKRVIPTAEPEPWLTKQLLLVNDKPTVGGALLFADEPQAMLPKRCGLKIYRYKTSGTDGSRETLAFDPITIEGCVYDQIKEAVRTTVSLVEDIQRLGPTGLEPIRYPHETLHEILTNAILHRDYSILTDVHVRIFDNRVEIESPGRLPGHITTANILQEQFARNAAVVRLINKFPEPPNKDIGEGLNTAFREMKKLRLKPPEIQECESSVLVRIRHEPLASPTEAIMAYLDTHAEITNRVGRQLTGIESENSMKGVFYGMRNRRMIEPVPGKKSFASAWRKVQQSPAAPPPAPPKKKSDTKPEDEGELFERRE